LDREEDPPSGPEGAVRTRRRTLAGVARRVERRLASRAFLDVGGGPEHAVLLAGSGRSGTTWIAEVVARTGGYRFLFEPFHPVRSPVAGSFPARLYLEPEDRASQQTAAARRVVEGRVRDRWVDQYNRRAIARRRLIKDVWSNGRLGWLRTRFPGLRLILVVRHPCPTVASQLATGWNWYADPSTFLEQPALMRRHLAPFRDAMAAARDDLERYVQAWCVDTLVPLRELRPGDVHLVFYEHLLARPERELSSLFAFLGRRVQDDRFAAAATPSALSTARSAIVTGEDAIASWTRTVPEDHVRRTVAILERFGLEQLYGPEPRPRFPSGAAALEHGWT
jgi:hypothetical protein